MQIGRFPRKTILAATLLLAFSAANASFLEQIGSPPATTVAMTTYGVDVATRVGLKAVIPSGWQLFVHRSVELPESLSWKVEESWVSVLSNFAKANDIAVLVDWDKKSVYFRSTALALQEQEKRQMIAQAAATPLPSFKSEEPATPSAPAVAAPVVAAASQPPAEKSVAEVTAPTPAPVVVAAASAPAAVGTTEAKPPVAEGVVEAPKPVEPKVSLLDRVLDAAAQPAAAKPSAKTVETEVKAVVVAQVAPNTAAPNAEAVKTAAADKVVETVAAKVETPAVVAVVAPEVVKTAAATPPVETVAAKAVVAAPGAVMNGAAAQAALAAAAAVPDPTLVPASVPMAAPAPAYTEQVLAAEKPAAEAFNRQSVDMVVRSAAEKHGYLVSWEAADVQFPGPVTILGADMGEDMRLVLRALGGRRSPVSIDVYRASNVVRVRNASGTAEVAFSELPFQGAIREKSAPTFTVKVRPETAVLPTLVAAPAPVAARPAPAAPVMAEVAPVAAPVPAPVVAMAAPAPVAPVPVVPEPARLDTAVPAVKKLEEAAPMVAAGTPAAPQVVTGEAETRPEPKPVVAAVVLRVERGEALHAAIEALLEPGWSLKWDVNGDMEANTALEVAGESLAAVLNKVLPRLALSADIYKPSKLVVIRPADAALDK